METDPDFIHDGGVIMQGRQRLTMALLLGFTLAACAWCAQAKASQCVQCHTTPARLVPAVRELQAAAARLPGSSELTAGEG
jgi:hypothetical protein